MVRLYYPFLLLVCCLTACQKEDSIPSAPSLSSKEEAAKAYQTLIAPYLKLPKDPLHYYGIESEHFKKNRIVSLGRVIFYDKSLSKDKTVSCASCHRQDRAFADALTLSRGVSQRQTRRNSPALTLFGDATTLHYGPEDLNFGSANGLFWDGRAANLSAQLRETIPNENEMGISVHEFCAQMTERSYYPPLFRQVFGDETVTERRVFESISEFIIAFSKNPQSEFDKTLQGRDPSLDFPDLPNNINRGRQLFVAKCNTCHNTLNPSRNSTMANNGLELDYADQGRYEVTGNALDRGVFKAPPLRNIAVTAPYMHDGRFPSLKAVVDHYSEGIKSHPNLHLLLSNIDGKTQQHIAQPLHLSATEKEDLIAFLETLTDWGMLLDERFSDPFRE